MNHFLVCKNPACRFVLDRRIDGKSFDSLQLLKKCPDCGGDWSSSCPRCGQALAMKMVDGLPYASCCGQKLRARARAA
jgi:predicted amidophosphoribosyltransferase